MPWSDLTVLAFIVGVPLIGTALVCLGAFRKPTRAAWRYDRVTAPRTRRS